MVLSLDVKENRHLGLPNHDADHGIYHAIYHAYFTMDDLKYQCNKDMEINIFRKLTLPFQGETTEGKARYINYEEK